MHARTHAHTHSRARTQPTSPFSQPNVKSRAQAYTDEVKRRSAWYRHSNLLVPFGDDFMFQNSRIQFSNMDALIDEINGGGTFPYGVRIQYGTVSEYIDAVQEEEITWPVYEADFFPYADSATSYWTGPCAHAALECVSVRACGRLC